MSYTKNYPDTISDQQNTLFEDGVTVLAERHMSAIRDAIQADETALVGMSNNVDHLTSTINTKADKVGSYPSLVAGGAKAVINQKPITNKTPYTKRDSNGNVASNIKQITGGSIVWNQVINNDDTGSYSWRAGNYGTLSISNNNDGSIEEVTYRIDSFASNAYLNMITFGAISGNDNANRKIFSNHVMFLSGELYVPKPSEVTLFYNVDKKGYKTVPAGWNKISVIIKNSNNVSLVRMGPNVNSSNTRGYEVYDEYKLRLNVKYIDLTTMFGEAVAEALLSMEENNPGTATEIINNMFPNEKYGFQETGVLAHVQTSGRVLKEYDGTVIKSYPLDGSKVLYGIPVLDSNGNICFDGDTYKSDGTLIRKYEVVGYAVGDEEDPNCLTDLSHTVRARETAVQDSASSYEAQQVMDVNGTEEFVYTPQNGVTNTNAVFVPVGHITEYNKDITEKIVDYPEMPQDDGCYIIQRKNGVNTWIKPSFIATEVSAVAGSGTQIITGQLFLSDNKLYKATGNIAEGDTVSEHAMETSIAAEIESLNSRIAALES